MKRIAWIDNLRVMVIILVVFLHSGVTYSGIGGWYYKEEAEIDTGSLLFFAFFITFTQAYFMSLLFMVSGYFSKLSLEKRGTKLFLRGRLKRLGIPLLIYMFLLHPLAVRIAYPDMDFWQWFSNAITQFDFLAWTGPLWFVEALLLFTFGYLLVLRFAKNIKINLKLTPQNVAILIMLITAVAFLLRLAFPIGTNVLNLQFSFFSAYIVLFIIGLLAPSSRLFEQISVRSGIQYLIISFAVGVPFWLFTIFFSGVPDGDPRFMGGWNWPAMAYAFWESFFCVTFIIALIGLFRFKIDISGSFQKFLSDNAFGVFVFHAPVLIATSMLFRDWEVYPVVKFFVVGVIAVAASYAVAWLVRRPVILRKIFS